MTAVEAGTRAADGPATRAHRPPPRPAWIALALVALVAVFGLLFYGEARYRNCIARAEAQYPAVAVSSFNQRATGPLKVSFVQERARALESCGRF